MDSMTGRDRVAHGVCALEYTLLCPTAETAQTGGALELEFVEPGCRSRVEEGRERSGDAQGRSNTELLRPS